MGESKDHIRGEKTNVIVHESMDRHGEMTFRTQEGGIIRVVDYSNESIETKLSEFDEESEIRVRVAPTGKNLDQYKVTEFHREGWI